MFRLGSVIGALIGWFVWHLPGAIIGGVVGWYFDRGWRQFQQQFTPENRQKVERAFFHAMFPLLGRIAKSDGRISEEEIAAAEGLMGQMRLSPEARKEAIELFQSGAKESFHVDEALREFVEVCGHFPNLKQVLLVYLISMAMSDGELHEAEVDILRSVSDALGYPPKAFEQILRMAQAQGAFHGQRQGEDPAKSLKLAYEALGVEETVSDAELKRAYRKLMSQYHPDKLTGQGVPEEMIKVATERSQEIQTAYDLIKKSRGK